MWTPYICDEISESNSTPWEALDHWGKPFGCLILEGSPKLGFKCLKADLLRRQFSQPVPDRALTDGRLTDGQRQQQIDRQQFALERPESACNSISASPQTSRHAPALPSGHAAYAL